MAGKPYGRRRVIRVVAAVLGILVMAAGAVAVLAALAQRGEGGYYGTPEQRFTTPAVALKSDEIDVTAETARPGNPSPDIGELARVRVVVRALDPAVPVFVGIGPKHEVEAYLRGTAYDEFAGAELMPFRASFRRVEGTAPATDPRGRHFWVATSAGAGTRTLEWDKTGGAWSIVVMRLDGQPGVDVHASMGLRFGFLLPVGAAGLVAGALLLAYGAVRFRWMNSTSSLSRFAVSSSRAVR